VLLFSVAQKNFFQQFDLCRANGAMVVATCHGFSADCPTVVTVARYLCQIANRLEMSKCRLVINTSRTLVARRRLVVHPRRFLSEWQPRTASNSNFNGSDSGVWPMPGIP